MTLTRTAAEWQPIETAPKDGTRVLVSYPLEGGWQIYLAAWERKNSSFIGRFEGWYIDRAHYALTCITKKVHFPTHWMPLPEPPK